MCKRNWMVAWQRTSKLLVIQVSKPSHEASVGRRQPLSLSDCQASMATYALAHHGRRQPLSLSSVQASMPSRPWCINQGRRQPLRLSSVQASRPSRPWWIKLIMLLTLKLIILLTLRCLVIGYVCGRNFTWIVSEQKKTAGASSRN